MDVEDTEVTPGRVPGFLEPHRSWRRRLLTESGGSGVDPQ